MSVSALGGLSGAASGAAIGTAIFPGIGTAIGAGLGGLAGLFSNSGSDDAAKAAQDIAKQQMDMAGQWRTAAIGAAGPSSGELDSLSKQNSLAMQANAYAQQHIALAQDVVRSSYNNVSLAQQQQQDILNGKIPSYLDPLQKQLAIQSQQAQNRINGTLGQGASSSSAGILASAQFGQQNAMTLMNAQQNALGALGQSAATNAGIGQGASAGALGALGTAGTINSQLNSGYAGIQQRLVNANLGTNIAQYGGAGSVGQLYAGQAQQAQTNQLLGSASAFAMNSAFSPYSPFRSNYGNGAQTINSTTPSGTTGSYPSSWSLSGGNVDFGGSNPYASQSPFADNFSYAGQLGSFGH